MRIALIISVWFNIIALISLIIYLYTKKQYNKETNKIDTDTNDEDNSDDDIVVNPNDFMILDDDEKPCREIPDYNEASKKASEAKKRFDDSVKKDQRQEILHQIESAIVLGDNKVWVEKYKLEKDPELFKYLTVNKHYTIMHNSYEYCIMII